MAKNANGNLLKWQFSRLCHEFRKYKKSPSLFYKVKSDIKIFPSSALKICQKGKKCPK